MGSDALPPPPRVRPLKINDHTKVLAADPLTRLVFNPLIHLLVRRRNAESLRRLEELAVGSPA